MLIGAHVSISGGIENAPQNARDLGCECFQIFSRSPQGGPVKKIGKGQAKAFEAALKEYEYSAADCVIHSPYFINLASKNNRIFYGSVTALQRELQVADQLNIPFVITHLGSARDTANEEEAQKLTLKGLRKIFKDQKFQAQLLLEIAAGSGQIMGSRLEEIETLLNELEEFETNLGFCLDTCHAFASGYDFSKPKKVPEIFEEVERVIGKDKLKIIHLNDSRFELGSRKDRHAHLGEGQISEAGLQTVVKWAQKNQVNLILETKHDKILKDLEKVRQWREASS
jgi:deoxyribonuclease-4